MAYVSINIHKKHIKQFRHKFNRFMENDQQIFDCYYIMRMFLIDNNDWHVRCYHITCAEHTRRSKRIAKWFEYKLATRGQDLIAEKLKGNNEYVWGWRGGERVPISDS